MERFARDRLRSFDLCDRTGRLELGIGDRDHDREGYCRDIGRSPAHGGCIVK